MRPPRWTPAQLSYLRERAQFEPVYYPARALGMNESTARWYLKKWGIPIIPRQQKWSVQDEQYLQDMVTDMTVAEIAKALIRTEQAVRIKASRMGLHVNQSVRRMWTPEEDRFLYDATMHMSLREAGKHLGRSKTSVRSRCLVLGIRWTQGRRSYREVALDLGCHQSYIPRLAKKAGVRLRPTRGGGMNHVSDEQYNALCEAWFGPIVRRVAAAA
jgi:hypothetical protein